MSPKCKVSFFFFLNYSQRAAGRQKGRCHSRASAPRKPPQSNETIRERKRKQRPTFGIWFYPQVFPRAPPGIASERDWQTRIQNTQAGVLGAFCQQRRLCAVRLWGAGRLARAGGPGSFPLTPPPTHGAPSCTQPGRGDAHSAWRLPSRLGRPFSSLGLGGPPQTPLSPTALLGPSLGS